MRQGNGIVVAQERLMQELDLSPSVVLNHVTEDGLVIDDCLHLTPVENLAGLDHKGIAAQCQSLSGKQFVTRRS